MSASEFEEPLNVEQQLAQIARAREETRKFIAEQHKLMAEAGKLDRDRILAPFQLVIGSMAAGAALFGAGVASVKLLGP